MLKVTFDLSALTIKDELPYWRSFPLHYAASICPHPKPEKASSSLPHLLASANSKVSHFSQLTIVLPNKNKPLMDVSYVTTHSRVNARV